ncbi:ATP-dependent zinc metalloprotease FtsH [Candidatus Methylacidiphilum fumarolicum]|uniref:ATP-dependent zinc metalloprotease FtsH n=2 Tax=Candidatus Methylacidiphilum fumarolicum TaxID=591154 RepID=I0JW98_METFB|nr:ATP-dependent zinc metalloprotease FtsH [Candidatus Methylacidiphilum fumarolicum]MBW6415827.1 ATP-dependent zinc metalloprotease FtsH [Candidatus Methylacidiphilum fumarolicum]TFE67610.1 cell division protein FtsH [Candidatus Methylacidiphilum fumarolicum]TFE72297.1 ATP-dependent zinc metalloprotease FtsH [Candidatus Methylacidiphilum fumarolicum]TFE75467.1 ATP-dependent zinc metalloprotease FtsH [Candidatus Methylacidiphilum fumarolicum]TFE77695.1 cell division protein FtsH [Candidatus Me
MKLSPPKKNFPTKKEPEPPFPYLRFLVQIGIALFLVWLWQESLHKATVSTIPYSEFLNKLNQKEIVECKITPDEIYGKMLIVKPEEKGKPPRIGLFSTVRVDDPDLVKRLQAAGVVYGSVKPSLLSQILFSWVVPILIFFLVWFALARFVGGGGAGYSLLNIGKSRARLLVDESTGVTFADVAGCDEAKYELQEVVDFLKNPSRYKALGAKIPKGVLLVGPPGTGKTLLAKAVAGEAKVPFFSISGSEFVEMFVGVGAARVRDLFGQAKAKAPCIIFIDELDAIGRQRGIRIQVGSDEHEQTLNQLLVEMDGFDPNEGIIVLAATNRPEILDRALLRPGRFDRQVVVDLPDANGREAILKVHAKGKPLSSDINFKEIAQATMGFSGADLANLLNEAALLAARRKSTCIEQKDLFEAMEKVIAGPERKSRVLSEKERERVAYHEVGHALVAFYLEHAEPVRKISIVPRGRAALGYTLQLPASQQYLLSKSELLDRICVAMGGRAAEELIYKDVTTGAENDLEVATTIARQMVCLYGMGEKSGLSHYVPPQPLFGGLDSSYLKECSNETARIIELEIEKILEENYEKAKSILQQHLKELQEVTTILLAKETLSGEEFKSILDKVKNQEGVSYSSSVSSS